MLPLKAGSLGPNWYQVFQLKIPIVSRLEMSNIRPGHDQVYSFRKLASSGDRYKVAG